MVIKKDVKDIVEANNRVLGTILKIELASTKQELKTELASKKDVKRLEQKRDSTIGDHEERITQLENAADLTHKN